MGFLGLVLTVALMAMAVRGRIYVHIRYCGKDCKDQIFLEVKLFNLIPLFHLRRSNVAVSQARHWLTVLLRPNAVEKQSRADHVGSLGERLRRVNYTRMLVKGFLCETLSCRIRTGLENAAETAWLYGILQSVSGMAASCLRHRKDCQIALKFTVIPDFQERRWEVFFEGIFSARLLRVAVMVWRALAGGAKDEKSCFWRLRKIF